MRRENANTSTEPVVPEADEGESILGRWSRRKRRVRAEREASAPVAPAESQPPEAAGAEGQPPEQVLTDDDMPPIDSLGEDSDYSGFLSPGVSDALRNAALKKMFLSPKYNITDGLDDYADDFTKFTPLGDIITSDMRHQMELAEDRAKKAMEEELAASHETTSDPATDAETPGGRDDGERSAASDRPLADADDRETEDADVGDAPDDGTRSG